MKIYIGVKIIKAEPMTGEEATLVLNRPVGIDEGYLVQYADGYRSWSPKDTFDDAHRLLSNLELRMLTDNPVDDHKGHQDGKA
ncbi:MAG: hypothetical protein ACTSQF_01940 [Candidatus Heimdallarchaeaceae archaeon]